MRGRQVESPLHFSAPHGCGETRTPMSNNSTTLGNWSAEPPRSRRARTESMAISLRRTGGLYEVRVASGRIYDVDMSIPACTCPDWQERQPVGGCKHLRRVDMEITARTVPGPDGQVVRQSASTQDNEALESSTTGLITGPHTEFDPQGAPTGHVYYRCSECGQEALRRVDVHDIAESKPCSNLSSTLSE